MRYKRIKRIPNTSNRDLNLVSRQQYAIEMIKVYQNYKRVVNIDETWINQSDFRHKCWRTKGSTQSMPKSKVQPRISLIAGIDNFGEVYLCFTQANTNNKVMNLFLSHFAKTMEFIDKNWRQNTVFLFDGKYIQISNIMILRFIYFRSKISSKSSHTEKNGYFRDESYIQWSSKL